MCVKADVLVCTTILSLELVQGGPFNLDYFQPPTERLYYDYAPLRYDKIIKFVRVETRMPSTVKTYTQK